MVIAIIIYEKPVNDDDDDGDYVGDDDYHQTFVMCAPHEIFS